MISDFKTLKNGTNLDADLCIVGAGAAGITIAREFIGRRLRVCVVESGGLEFDDATQSLYEGKNVGVPYYNLDACRLRYFGGTTNHWSGQCAPLYDMDFQHRPWVKYSGWPISRTDLDPYYERALPVCQLGPYIFDGRNWENVKHLQISPPDFSPTKIRSHFWQNAPTRFGTVYREELRKAENIEVFLNANVTNIEVNNTGSTVRRIDLQALNGTTGHIRAKIFVLACGGMENPRLLLNSSTMHRTGIGNQNDLVGRFFMDHLSILSGVVVSVDAGYLPDVYLPRAFKGTAFRPGLGLADEEQKREGVLNVCTTFETEEEVSHGVESIREVIGAVKDGQMPDDLGEIIKNVFTDLDTSAPYAFCRLTKKKNCTDTTVFLRTRLEQAPNPNSRLLLSEDLDALGQKRLRLDWRPTELERRTVRAMSLVLGREFGRLNLGRVQLSEWLMKDIDPEWKGNFHHMGTTRMAEDPKMGVVNKDCRVHGVKNLYIAGSSVFPTSGFVNPTFTIVALALRLADHFSDQLKMT